MRDLVALLVGNAVLALGPWLVRLADVGPVAAGFWRLALALPVLAVLALRSRRAAAVQAVPPTLWGALAIGGLFFAADLALWHAGIHQTRLANATLFGNVTSFTYPLYAFLIARAWPGPNQRRALLLAGAGVLLLLGRSYEVSAKTFAGDLLCIGAGLCYTGYLVAIARNDGRVSSMAALAVSTAAGVLPLLGVALWLKEAVWPQDWLPLLALAGGSQLLGQGLIVYSVGRLPPAVVGISLLVQPVVAATIGWVGYGERLGLLDLVGAVAIAVALVLVRRPDRPVAAVPTG
ncbi:DMT family transporter [Sphingomonas jatrophae]|uniref:EamA-like transporter family protein n=1 Tax=Sphingomonas jatrophae TaxID=1166337 RepID=A0A1I6LPX1_9SPHN|nr:DMT family transporter [Sphingomonas jatrophae]SFS05525.1 EamA-like transporter family protein [Sphingomonas jatrophae]